MSRQGIKELLSIYNTDKDKLHTYGNIYDEVLTPYRDTATAVLEIGVLNGDSLRAWRDFFPSAHIIGIDNDSTHTLDELRITTHVGDQQDETFLFNVGFKYGPFDFICDDGSHVLDHQLQSLLHLRPFLKADGIYAVEDIQSEDSIPIFQALGATVYDLRSTNPNGVRDDIIAIFRRARVNYGFKCPEESCSATAFFSILTPMGARPKCPKHDKHYIPDINWPDGVKVSFETITPDDAEELLQNAFPSSFEGVDETLVTRYADMMLKGQWRTITREMGGEHYPIYMRDDRVLLGIQRLQAIIRSATPLETVVVRTYGYY